MTRMHVGIRGGRSPVILQCAILLVFLQISMSARSSAQEAPINSQERSIVEAMLDDVKSTIKGNYYDPKFHGVDLDARFKEAKDRVKTATTYNQAIATVAWAIRPLNDSHTFLIPPRRTYRMDYGYQFATVGNQCYVLAVKPGADAERKGLKVGDQIVSLNKVSPSPENLWELHYIFRVLRPQAADELAVRSPDGSQRVLNVMPKVTGERMHIFQGLDYWDLVREWQSNQRVVQRRSANVGEAAIIWNFPTFTVNEKAIDEMLGESRKYPAMILDLRGNGGGYVATLQRLIGGVVDHDVTVDTPIMRKPAPPQVAKSRGDMAYKGKIIVLVDRRSASASEIFARTMQLEKRATVIGDKTSGSVMESRFHYQSLGLDTRMGHDSGQGYGLTVTEADVIMPDGKSLEHQGVTPDEVILPTANDLAAGRDPVLSYAVQMAGAKLSPEDAGKLFPMMWPPD